jgi:hypothetical protein
MGADGTWMVACKLSHLECDSRNITIFCDILTFLLPVPNFLKFQIDLKRKIGLIALFLLGLFTTACSVMRMVQIGTIAKNGNKPGLVLWAIAELNVGVSGIPWSLRSTALS